jgi:hypothetical protein
MTSIFESEGGDNMVMVKIDEEVFELKEIKWSEDSTYLLTAKEAKDEIGIQQMMMQLRRFLKSQGMTGITFLILPKETALIFEDKKRELIKRAFMLGAGSGQNNTLGFSIEEKLKAAIDELCGDDRGLDPLLPLARKPDPNIIPPTYDVVTEGYDPSKIKKKGEDQR